MGNSFSIDDVPDMTDKVCIVTGANSGRDPVEKWVELTPTSNGDLLLAIINSSQIGNVCATVLAKKGAHVCYSSHHLCVLCTPEDLRITLSTTSVPSFLACRTASKTNPIVAEIKSTTGNNKVEFLELDLLSLTSVASCAETFKARKLPLHLLLNNAGVMSNPFTLSADGLESQFATNHVGHFLLTMQLLPILEASAPSRIVEVSSVGHNLTYGGLGLEYLNDPKKYTAWYAYARSKLANILFVRELNKRLEAKGVKNVYVNANHPGSVGSDIFRHTHETTAPKFLIDFVKNNMLMSLEAGAATQMYLATSPEVEEKDIRGHREAVSGSHRDGWKSEGFSTFVFSPRSQVPIAKPGRTSWAARDDKLAEELWTWTVNTLKEKVPGYSGPTI
ncbi:LOW QUALITY PROTEIN: hypothetical protein BC936DRAFT_139517 [Jimgerdemannia flammicorona]|uniref:Uncharacterized protein n=1 Tax=Jimgerdemannia flammicorona TaxID=994334 RepID=A0A433B9R1_9FUNG|nr:LOW QUALITY PROTEIN: hypothetical protein BC936DRAFT_139517 [Jimgerdemannia flammicorona]